MFRIFFSILIITLIAFGNIYSQELNKSEKKKLFSNAVKLFNDEKFEEALVLFLKLDANQSEDFETKYYIGACYLNTKYAKTSGIPYLEYAIKNGEKLLPPDVFKDLGTLYHLDYQFDKAIDAFNKYIDIAFKDDENIDYIKRYIEICNNAKIITSDTLKIEIQKLGNKINSAESELDPHVSADESIIYFTRETITGDELIITDSISKVLFSEKESDIWSFPKEVSIDLNDYDGDVSIAGISPDGNKMFILLKEYNGKKDLYTCNFYNNKCRDLVKLNNKINSEFDEGKASITPDGSEFYFSSSRDGGFGGKDIYKIIRRENGEWSEPFNLGPMINTEYDEDAPFIHPDKKTLYFSSNGHNSIGGFDIFKTDYNYIENKWSEPINIGYPINSTFDDINFVLSADGNSGYFSSSQGNKLGLHDIYKVLINKAIPLTLVKGLITAGTPPKPISAKIRVYDNETNERVKYIYDPDPESGKYLMIFPPGKNYRMIIEAEGFLPRQINIYIPNQTYFYELFQEIHLSPITMKYTGKIVGEEITIKNTFYDIYGNNKTDSLLGQVKSEKDYSKLLSLIEELIEKTDSIGLEELDYYSKKVLNTSSEVTDRYYNKSYDELLDIIENAIEAADSNRLSALNMNTLYVEDLTNKHFYDIDDKENSLVDVIIGNDTIKVLPKLLSTGKNNTNLDINSLSNKKNELDKKNNFDIRNSNNSQRRYILQSVIYFNTGETIIRPEFETDLISIATILLDQPGLGVEINGYTDTNGAADKNQILSESRARSILKFFIKHKVNTDKIIINGYGESKSTNELNENDRKLNRKAEVHVFEIVND